MALISSRVEHSDDFARRQARLDALVAELRARSALVAAGGGEQAVERHRGRGKLLARERIDRLVDPGTAFLELNALAAWEVYDGQAPSAGIVTGIGVVEGRECVIVANDATVKGGSLLPPHREEASAGAGDRGGEPAAVPLSRRFGRRLPAAAGGGVSRPRALRPDLLQPGADVGRTGFHRSPW